ncbi:MAG: hypothetical protein BWY63_00910 [Chloroflexi bacterium ADurb.Bin360]|nr:MAG: hypothetical protein BWY63_00910 [Chloroflexi bacterium ADurb.Bin360]
MRASSEYIIFPKTHDLVLWLMQTTQHFPRSQRFVMAKRVQDAALDFHDTLIAARKAPAAERERALLRADVALETLRLHLRLCQELHLLTGPQYSHVSALVVEVGKLLGAWRQGKGRRPEVQDHQVTAT